VGEKPDLVILDIKLPDKDGLQLLDELKILRREIPVVMHTSFDFMYDFAADTSDAYVVKSSDMTDLKRTIRRLLAERRVDA
jgi:DNA-binding NarL/FixJ family response regulator